MNPLILATFGWANHPLNRYYRIGAKFSDDLAWWYAGKAR